MGRLTGRLLLAMIVPVLLTSACQEPGGGDRDNRPQSASAWTAPPRVTAVEARRDGLTIIGDGPAGLRVVLTSEGRQPAAISIDTEGRFALPIPRPAEAQLYRLDLDEPTARRAGERLFIAPDGTAAVLAPGRAARALTETRGLTAVDHDSSELIASGVVVPGAPVSVSLDDQVARETRADATGRFVVSLGQVAVGPHTIGLAEADGPRARTTITVAPASTESLDMTPDGQGLSVSWRPAGGGAQRTWIRREKD